MPKRKHEIRLVESESTAYAIVVGGEAPRNMGEMLKQYRKAVGLTIAELSGRSGVNKATLSLLENNKLGLSEGVREKLTTALADTFNENRAKKKAEAERREKADIEAAAKLAKHAKKYGFDAVSANLNQYVVMSGRPELVEKESARK